MMATAVLLLVLLSSTWYAIDISSRQTSGNLSFSPDGQITLSSSSITASASYATARLNATGSLYSMVELLLIGGILTAGIGGALAAASPWRPNLRKGAAVLGAVGLLFAVICPVVLLLEQPSALNTDFSHGYVGPGGGSTTSSGVSAPWNSFYGSISTSGGNESWGPTLEWYLAFAAGGISLVGAVLAGTARPLPGAMTPSFGAGSVPTGAGGGVAPAYAPPANTSEANPPIGSAEGYLCSRCQTRFTSVAEFQAHLRDAHPT